MVKTHNSSRKIHDYLGMDIDWIKDGKISISMIRYLCQSLDDFVQDIRKTSATPAAEYLFKIRETVDAAKLPEEFAVIFSPHNC